MLSAQNQKFTCSTDKEEIPSCLSTSIELEQIVFNLNEDNYDLSIKTIKLFDINYPYSFNGIISNLVYKSFSTRKNNINIYLNYLESIQIKEEEINKDIPKIINIFCKHISKFKTQETYYIIEKMIELNLIDVNIVKRFQSKYFAHRITRIENETEYDLINKLFTDNDEELSKNDWELHKQLIKEGHNPNEIAKIIRNDEIDKLSNYFRNFIWIMSFFN